MLPGEAIYKKSEDPIQNWAQGSPIILANRFYHKRKEPTENFRGILSLIFINPPPQPSTSLHPSHIWAETPGSEPCHGPRYFFGQKRARGSCNKLIFHFSHVTPTISSMAAYRATTCQKADLPFDYQDISTTSANWLYLKPLSSLHGWLCSRNHEYPRIRFCVPNPVTAKSAVSEWSLYVKTISATSVISPESFGVPSTLKTGMLVVNWRVGMRWDLTYPRSMKSPVAPLSTSARTWRLTLDRDSTWTFR